MWQNFCSSFGPSRYKGDLAVAIPERVSIRGFLMQASLPRRANLSMIQSRTSPRVHHLWALAFTNGGSQCTGETAVAGPWFPCSTSPVYQLQAQEVAAAPFSHPFQPCALLVTDFTEYITLFPATPLPFLSTMHSS